MGATSVQPLGIDAFRASYVLCLSSGALAAVPLARDAPRAPALGSRRCMEDWTVLLVPAIALTVLGLLAYFQVPIGGCAAASAVDEFGGGARTKKRR